MGILWKNLDRCNGEVLHLELSDNVLTSSLADEAGTLLNWSAVSILHYVAYRDKHMPDSKSCNAGSVMHESMMSIPNTFLALNLAEFWLLGCCGIRKCMSTG